MSPAAVLAILAVLLLPVGLNRLLRRAAARLGLARALPLLGAGWLAACLAIGTWCTALGLLTAVATAARPLAQAAIVAYLLWRLLAPRRQSIPASAWTLFPAALADPAVLWCAAFAFPALGAPAPAILAGYGWFTVLMLAAGVAWSAAGAGLLPRRPAVRRPLRRAALLAAGTTRLR